MAIDYFAQQFGEDFFAPTYSSTDEQGNPIYDQVAAPAPMAAPVAAPVAPVAEPAYFQTNPDVASAYSNYASQYTPQQFADFHYTNYGASEGRAASSPAAEPITPVSTPTAPVTAPVQTVSDADILGWFNANPGASDTLIAQTMQQANVTPEQVARATTANYQDVNSRYLTAIANPATVQQQIIADERNRSNDGIASLAGGQTSGITGQAAATRQVAGPTPIAAGEVHLGNGLYRTREGITVDSQGKPVVDNTKTVNDLYATIGRTGMGTDASQIDKAGFDYWKQIADSGLTPEQLKQRFNTEVNTFLTTKQTDPYSQYVAPIYLKSLAGDILNDTTLSAFDKNNKIFETAQKFGMNDAAIDKAFGKTAADAYRKDYGNQIKSFIDTTLAKDEGTTFNEVAAIQQAARTYGLDASEVAKYSGMNKAGVDTLFGAYDKGLANIAKGFEDARIKAGTDATALSDAEANKAKTMLALQSQYKVTDEDLAKAGNTTVKAVQDYLAPVKEAPKTLEALMNDTKMSASEIRAKIDELKANPAVSGIYSAALQKFSDKAAKDYSGEYGGKKFESLNPIAVSTVLDQLKAQQAAGTAQYYQGGAKEGKKGGFGSLDAMTEDMAKNLVAAGITDIRQVGEKTVTVPGEITYDENGNATQQPDRTEKQIINKVTGEPLSKASNYSERTVGNSWSGTFKGKGNTGYNVQFKDGNPIFYTTGASSSDMQQLAPLLAVASFIPGAAPFVAGINALYAADQGNWKQALLSALPVGGEIAKTLGASANTLANIGTASKIANVANAIDNKDLLGLALSGTGLASDKNLFGEGAFNPKANILGNFSTKDLLSGASALKAIDNKDLVSLANIGAQMSGSKDAATAAKGLAVVKALESKNPMAIAQIAQKFNLTNDVIGKAGGGLASLPGLIKNGNKNTLTDKNAFDGLNGSLVAKMLNQQPPAIRAAMLEKIMQAA
jgi:hypothetical protein